MARVYSEVFFRSDIDTTYSLPPIPDGYVWIIRSIQVFCDNGSLVDSNYLTIDVEGTVVYWSTTDPDTTTYDTRELRSVCNAGDVITVIADGTFAVSISGYALTTP